MINNALTLIGINVFILYAVYGLLIFAAVLLDRVARQAQGADLLPREPESSGGAIAGGDREP